MFALAIVLAFGTQDVLSAPKKTKIEYPIFQCQLGEKGGAKTRANIAFSEEEVVEHDARLKEKLGADGGCKTCTLTDLAEVPVPGRIDLKLRVTKTYRNKEPMAMDVELLGAANQTLASNTVDTKSGSFSAEWPSYGVALDCQSAR